MYAHLCLLFRCGIWDKCNELYRSNAGSKKDGNVTVTMILDMMVDVLVILVTLHLVKQIT